MIVKTNYTDDYFVSCLGDPVNFYYFVVYWVIVFNSMSKYQESE